MEAKRSKVNKVLLLAVGVVLLLAIVGVIFLTSQVTVAESYDAVNWSYPSEWEKIGGDQKFVLVQASNVLKSEYYEGDSDFRKGGDVHGSIDIDEIHEYATPTIYIRRTFLKGYFEGSYYIAVLIDLEMDPANKYTGHMIRSANAQINTYIYKAKKVGSLLVTYWPTTEVGGYYVQGAPEAASDTVTQSVGISLGFQGSDITGGFSVARTSTRSRLEIRGKNMVTDDEANGYEVRYKYYQPYEDDVAYTESKSSLQYVTIYRCDPAVDMYDINVSISGEFFYDGSALRNAIVRGIKVENFYIKPSTGYFHTYGI